MVSEGDLAGSRLMALQPPPPLGYSSLSTISVTAHEGPILEELPEAGVNNDLTLFEFVQLLEKEHGFVDEGMLHRHLPAQLPSHNVAFLIFQRQKSRPSPPASTP